MAVSINFRGRTGNKIFQYCAARVFAEQNGINLLTQLDCDILDIKPAPILEEIEELEVKVFNDHNFDEETSLVGKSQTRFHFDGFFQNSNFMRLHRRQIKEFLNPQEVVTNYDDIVLHLRLDDFVKSNDYNNPESWERSEIIHPDYYQKILENETYNRVYIVVDKIKYGWEQKYLSNFKKYEPVIVSGDARSDFNFLRSFDKIICSNSTFSYWSAFLSNARTIYGFKDFGFYGRMKTSHGVHCKNLCTVTDDTNVIDSNFYFGE